MIHRHLTPVIRIIVTYLIVSGLWIFSSDQVAAGLITDSLWLTKIQTYKGWFFVAASAALLFVLIYREQIGRRQAEEALQLSQASFNQLFDQNPIPMWVYDQHSLHFLAVNDAAVQKYGYTQAEFLLMKITDIRPEEEPRAVYENLANAPPGLRASGQWRHRTHAGRTIIAQVASHTLDFSGKLAVLVVAEDITYSKHVESAFQSAEQRRIAAENLLRLDESRFEALYNLSQMIDIPLRGISDYALSEAVQLTGSARGTLAYRVSIDNRFECFVFSPGRPTQQLLVDLADPQSVEKHRLWSALLRKKKPMLINNLADYQEQVDRPPLEFVRELIIPIQDNGQVVAIANVQDKKSDYSDADLRQLNLLMDGVWKISERHQMLDRLRESQSRLEVAIEQLQQSNDDLTLAYDATIEGWSRAMELRDRDTQGHTRRVTQLTTHLAQIIGIDEDQIVHIRRGALLHDIGKMGIPDPILLKPGPLTEDEWEIMRMHPNYAYEMLSTIPYLHPAIDIPYYHHERWDGKGYPHGLQGEKIPLSARIFTVVDIWDALRSDRPYRNAWPLGKVVEYIQDQSGRRLDPQVVEVFLEHIHEFSEYVPDILE